MDAPLIIEASCPQCGAKALITLVLGDVVQALLNQRTVRLRGTCGHHWSATPVDIDNIHRCLTTLGIETPRR